MSVVNDDVEEAPNLPKNILYNDSKPKEKDSSESSAESYDDEAEDVTHLHFNSADYISKPKQSQEGTIPSNILEFHHSFGYDCRKFFNLCVADANTLVFASGNLIHFFDIAKNKLSFRRSSTGQGIGHITKNPAFSHIAIGENGKNPPIIIYEWPSMEIVTILKKGTSRSYLHLSYNPDGLLLVSQGGEPDYLITIWNWQKSRTILRCKSHSQDVYNVIFSPSVYGHLTSCGAGHIKFWKMVKTFTGLKLKGDLGRFGKIEISDIVGVYSMEDGKVVSGCEWGNILLWVEGMIKLEICRKNRKPCHAKMITQFEYSNGELISVGMDGWICVWYYETIDLADPPEDDRFLEIEPIYEFLIREDKEDILLNNSMLMCIQRLKLNDPEQTTWYAQDGNGGLWNVDLSTLEKPQTPIKLLSCHAGPITDMDVANWGPFVATCGKDGRLHIYNYLHKKLIHAHKFYEAINSIKWFSCKIESSGCTLACGFESGVIRIVTTNILKANTTSNIQSASVELLQALKPHTRPITSMTLNDSNNLLVTGSEDSTIFVFCVQATEDYPVLIPVGYVKMPSVATCITWKPENRTTVLVGCQKGHCVEVELPETPQNYTTVSYELVKCELKIFKFRSVKSTIKRKAEQMKMQEKKEVKLKKRKELQQQKIEIDINISLMDSEEEEEFPEIYIPEVPSQVLVAHYNSHERIWLFMSGFDAGYVYEFANPDCGFEIEKEPLRSIPISDAVDVEIRSLLFMRNKKYLILGMQHGEIRVCKIDSNDETNLSNYWILSMHDNFNGCIPTIKVSYDRQMLLTCGYDGNLFSFIINDNEPFSVLEVPKAKPYKSPTVKEVNDIRDLDHPSLEEVLVEAEQNRIVALAKQKKEETLAILRGLMEDYQQIIERNRNLPKTQQIPIEEFELDERITVDLNNQLNVEMNLVRKKLAYKEEKSTIRLKKLMDYFVEPITCLPFAVCKILSPNVMVHSLREQKLGDDFSKAYEEVTKLLTEKSKTGRVVDAMFVEEAMEEGEQEELEKKDNFLKDLICSLENEMTTEFKQMLKKYEAYNVIKENRRKNWKSLYDSKPNPNIDHPSDVAALEEAKNTIGDYCMKISENCNKKKDRDTVASKYKQILDCRKKVHYMREDYNFKLKMVRSKKVELRKEVLTLIEKLKKIHKEIPQNKVKPLPSILTIDNDIEFPEHNLELKECKRKYKNIKEARQKKMSMTEPMDDELMMLTMDDNFSRIDRNIDLSSLPNKTIYKIQSTIPVEILQEVRSNDRVETSLEREMKQIRMLRKSYEQDCILQHIQQSYEELDKRLDELAHERLNIVADCVYADLLSLTFNQELIILRNYESLENSLQNKVHKAIDDLTFMKQKVQIINLKVERKNKEINKYQDKITELQSKFINMIKENKFCGFLKKIFKRKYKPPKLNDESLSSSSSESSTESDTDDNLASSDNENLAIVHLNENICPEKCDKELYDVTLSMREKRYEYENQIKTEQKEVELLYKELDNYSRKVKNSEKQLRTSQNDLDIIVREKQQKLNDVDITVVLKFHQLQHISDSQDIARVKDCLIFDKETLSQLYVRVGQLEHETTEQKEKHKKYKTHLQRIKIDCDYMDGEIKRLQKEIKEEMIKKFGKEVSLSALYESVLYRMIYDMKTDINPTIKVYDEKIKCIKKKYKGQADLLQNLIKKNTEKLSFLTVLEEEEAKLRKILRQKPITEGEMLQIEQQYTNDLAYLENIFKNQLKRKAILCREIKMLSCKSKMAQIICPKDAHFDKNKVYSESENDEKLSKAKRINNTAKAKDTELYEEKNKNDEAEIFLKTEIKSGDLKLMVSNLYSHVIKTIVENTMLTEETQSAITSKLQSIPVNNSMEELQNNIKQNVESIINILKEDDNATDELIKSVQKNAENIILGKEFNVLDMECVHYNIKEKLRELLQSIGIQNNLQEIEHGLLQKMEKGNEINIVATYIMEHLPSDTEEETMAALYEHVIASLSDIFIQSRIKD